MKLLIVIILSVLLAGCDRSASRRKALREDLHAFADKLEQNAECLSQTNRTPEQVFQMIAVFSEAQSLMKRLDREGVDTTKLKGMMAPIPAPCETNKIEK